MNTMTSLRLESVIESRIDEFTKSSGITKSELIKRSLLEYFDRHSVKRNAFEIGKDLFGVKSNATSDLSSNRKKYIKEKLISKHEKRNSN